MRWVRQLVREMQVSSTAVAFYGGQRAA